MMSSAQLASLLSYPQLINLKIFEIQIKLAGSGIDCEPDMYVLS